LSTERAGAPAEPQAAPRDPSLWIVLGLSGAYLMALALLIFLPHGTLIERLRALDAGICAQLPTHSFHPAGQQLPLCARDTGIYCGFASTVIVLRARGRLRAAHLPGGWVAVALGLAVAVMAVDGFNSFFLDLRLPHLYQPNNLLRLATGLGTGTAMAAFLVPVANSLIWRDEDARAPFASLRELAVMAPVLALVFLLIASQPDHHLSPGVPDLLLDRGAGHRGAGCAGYAQDGGAACPGSLSACQPLGGDAAG
jgi:uncharacterized membrane protein